MVGEKSNILLIGRSGAGTTRLVKSLASNLNAPLLINDATSLTEAGYVGDDVECLFTKLIQSANGDLGVAQQGIVFFDEIDKIKSTGSGFRDLRQGVQTALLKMLEGTVVRVPPQAARSMLNSQASPSTRRTSCFSAAGHSSGWKRS